MGRRSIGALAFAALLCGAANAAQYNYQIAASFNDHGRVSGNVTFDNTSNPPTVVSASFATTPGRLINTGQNYSGVVSAGYNSTQNLYHYTWNETGTGFLFDISFTSGALSEINAGASSVLLSTLKYKKALGQQLTSGECDNCSPYRVLKHGSAITLVNGAAK